MIFTILRLLGLLGLLGGAVQQKQKNKKKARRAAGTGTPNCHLLDPALSIPTMSSGDSIYGVLPTTTTTPNPTPGTTHRLRATTGALIATAAIVCVVGACVLLAGGTHVARTCTDPAAHNYATGHGSCLYKHVTGTCHTDYLCDKGDNQRRK